jgi:hypothetical protein
MRPSGAEHLTLAHRQFHSVATDLKVGAAAKTAFAQVCAEAAAEGYEPDNRVIVIVDVQVWCAPKAADPT